MADLTKLIARLEALTDFDREIDLAIGLAIGGWRMETDPNFGAMVFVPEDNTYYPPHPGSMYPALTESLDIAMALKKRLLPDWRVENLCEWDAEVLRQRGPWTCDLMRRGKDFADHFPAKCPHAPNPAIALILATLKAKQAQEKTDE